MRLSKPGGQFRPSGDSRDDHGGRDMAQVRVHSYGVSLDGYAAGADQSFDNPLGVGGEGLHTWFTGGDRGRPDRRRCLRRAGRAPRPARRRPPHHRVADRPRRDDRHPRGATRSQSSSPPPGPPTAASPGPPDRDARRTVADLPSPTLRSGSSVAGGRPRGNRRHGGHVGRRHDRRRGPVPADAPAPQRPAGRRPGRRVAHARGRVPGVGRPRGGVPPARRRGGRPRRRHHRPA
jgi:hypothetical protein